MAAACGARWIVGSAFALVALAVSARSLVAIARAPLPGSQPFQVQALPAADTCARCHRELNDKRLSDPAARFSEDIHREKGFGCADCHGGDPSREDVEAMDVRRAYIGKPPRERIPQLCARCHADAEFMRRYNPAIRVDQFAEYQTSVHGRRLVQHHDPRVATCASCHSPHSIRPASDPQSTVNPSRVVETCGGCHANAAYMSSYGISTEQLALYKKSVHWETLTERGDTSAPTCNDCHGNHGAVPPGIDSVGNVCGQCHAVQGDLFRASRHSAIFKDIGTPGCVTCHSNHAVLRASDAFLGVGEGTACGTCHGADDPTGRAATEMRRLIDTLRSEYDDAHTLLLRAERSGVEVSQAQFDLNSAFDALVKARAAVHAFTVAAVSGPVTEGRGIAARAHARGVRAHEELQFRRRGLGVSVLIILTLIAALAMKIRQIERPAAGHAPPPRPGDDHAR
jgi:Cytochrome c3